MTTMTTGTSNNHPPALFTPRADALARVLRFLLLRYGSEVVAAIRVGRDVPDLTRQIDAVVEMVLPVLAPLWQHGAEQQARKLAAQNRLAVRRGFGPRGAYMALRVTKRFESVELSSFDVFNAPETMEAIRQAAFSLCQSTLETSTLSARRAVAAARQAIAEGLVEGEAVADLNRRLGEIFRDPFRAARIAQTEAARGMNGGAFLVARQAGVPKKSWVASADACDRCLKIGKRQPIALEKPFYVDPAGGPYALTMYPPLHPHCMCAWSEEW